MEERELDLESSLHAEDERGEKVRQRSKHNLHHRDEPEDHFHVHRLGLGGGGLVVNGLAYLA